MSADDGKLNIKVVISPRLPSERLFGVDQPIETEDGLMIVRDGKCVGLFQEWSHWMEVSS